jgi:signal transduction histidine kinase
MLKLNLQEENNLMKRIVEAKTQQLKIKIKEVHELLKQQSDFISVTAHELRTPLNIALFQIYDALHSDPKLPKAVEGAIQVIDESLQKLKNLTDKLFDVQQYDLNKVDFRPASVEISSYLKSIYQTFKPLSESQGIRLILKNRIKRRKYFTFDEILMSQALHNLLNNAIKFSDKGSSITLYADYRKPHLTLKIEDHGIGIPDSAKESVFNKFRTSHSSHSGLGLGLYICKKIIALHRGSLWAEDTPRGGSTFIIRLLQ